MGKSERYLEVRKLKEVASKIEDNLVTFSPTLYFLERKEESILLGLIPENMTTSGFVENIIRLVIRGKIRIKVIDNEKYFNDLIRENK